MAETKRYLINIKLGNTQLRDLKGIFSGVKNLLDEIITDRGEYTIAYVSPDAKCFGFFIRTDRKSYVIRSHLLNPGAQSGEYQHTPLIGNDAVLIVEIGEEFAATDGFGAAKNWLEHH